MTRRCTWVWPNSSRCGQLAQFEVRSQSGNHERTPCPRHLSATVKQLDRIAEGYVEVEVLPRSTLTTPAEI